MRRAKNESFTRERERGKRNLKDNEGREREKLGPAEKKQKLSVFETRVSEDEVSWNSRLRDALQ